jgi:hypothetical protein
MVCSKCEGWGKLPGPPPVREREGTSTIVLVEAGTPRTAHAEIEELLTDLQGEVRICDPYYGTGTLHRLSCLKGCDSVLFLTRQPDSRERSYVDRAFEEFKREYGQFEFRRHKGSELHDRYVLAPDRVLVLGHGLKDIGLKESFIIQLGADFASDIIATISGLFDQRWVEADPIV